MEKGGGKDPAAQGLHEVDGEVGRDSWSEADQRAARQTVHALRHA